MISNNKVRPLNLDDKSTWQNIPCPVDLSPIRAALKTLGTIQGHGLFHGKPTYEIIWGQEYQKFLNGKQRLVFDESNIDPVQIKNHYVVSPDLYVKALAWQTEQYAVRNQMFMNCQFSKFYNLESFPNFTNFIEKQSFLEWKKLQSDLTPEQISLNMPPGWRYLHGHRENYEVGEQAFYVLQHMPPGYYGAESIWKESRYCTAYVPELDDEVPIDVLGSYPTYGDYDHVVLRIANRVTKEFWNYKEPSVDYVMDRVQELIRLSEKLSKREKSAESITNRRVERFRSDQSQQQIDVNFDGRFNDAMPVGKGNPTNISANKNKDL